MDKKDKWYHNISLITFFIDTPIGIIGMLKNKDIKSSYRVGGSIIGLTVLILSVSRYIL